VVGKPEVIQLDEKSYAETGQGGYRAIIAALTAL
jgi:hypothetical protein